MKDSNKILTVEERTLKDKIVAIRGQQVMLDFDLAKIYGYTTKAFNQQVQRNIDRFPEDFLFRLTTEEVVNLRSQNVTSSWGGSRYPPFAFTEQGIYMLMITQKDYFALAETEQLGHCRCAVSFFAQLVLPLHAQGLTGHGQRRILQSNN